MRFIRVTLLAMVMAAASPLLVRAEDLVRFDIPAQDLGSALREFAKAAHQQIVFDSQRVQGLKSAPLAGSYSVDAALHVLLGNAALSLSKTAAGVYYVEAKSDGPLDASRGAANVANKEGLTEIVVTAQKRSERLQDVPMAVSVLDANVLADNGQNRLQDYFASVPGLSFTDDGSGRQLLAIRGIVTSDAGDPTIGVTIDDVPVGSSSRLGMGELLPSDIDPSDLARIEVLRGPQGTLYGASSMGGLIKYVTKDPSTDSLSGRVQALGDDVEHGEAGYGVRVSVNVPLSDTIAIRVSAFARRDPGYVDNVLTGQNDVNQIDAQGGRLAALWRVSDAVTLKVSALLQNSDSDGTSTIDANVGAGGVPYPTLGDLKQARLPGGEPFSNRVQLYTGTLTARFADIDFTSISGYGHNKYFDRVDGTLENGYNSETYFNVAGENDVNYFETKKFTQELRLSSSGTTLEWLAGAFYTHENSPGDQYSEAVEPATGTPVGTFIDFNFPTTLSEYALFGDLTYHVTGQFDVQMGARESWNKQVYNETDSGPLAGPGKDSYFGVSPFVNPTERINGNASTFLITPQFKVTPDLMLYARVASGYRLGGVNVNAVFNDTPIKYDPDKTISYELGLKSDFLEHALTFEAATYYIDWNKLQITVEGPTGPYVTNAGRAKSEGLELSLQARPIRSLRVAAFVSLNDAELTEALPQTCSFCLPSHQLAVGNAGDRLPFSSKVSGKLSVDQDVSVTSAWTGFIGGSVNYVGSRDGNFNYFFYTTPRLNFPGYANTQLHVGVRDDVWNFNLFANNLADRRGITSGNPSYAESPFYLVYIQPRTVGLSVSRSF